MDRKIEIFVRTGKESDWRFLSFGRLTDMYDIHDAGPTPKWVLGEMSRSLWAHQSKTFVELTVGATQYRVEVGKHLIDEYFLGCEPVHLGSPAVAPCELCGSLQECYEYSTEAEGIQLDGVICGSCFGHTLTEEMLDECAS